MIRMLLFLMAMSQVSWADPVIVKDLRQDWLQFDGTAYQPLQSSPIALNTIYFGVQATRYKGQYLLVDSREEWDVYVNGKLIASGRNQQFSIDSLAGLYGGDLFFGVHSAVAIRELRTWVVSKFPLEGTGHQILPRPPTFFLDYSIIATGFLLLFLLLLFRTNPQLTLDYFSFTKIFSVKERNENLLTTRITSSVNLLFYLFCALLTGFLLSLVFYFAGPAFRVAKSTEISSMGVAFWTWIKLSGFILLLLTSKLIIVLMFSSLFNFRETVSFQFFNFLRFVLFTAVTMAILSLIYFVFSGEQGLFYERLILLALTFLAAGSIMVLVKLLARAPFSFFHLFSYLCASEIIPLVIIIKIFF